MKTLVMIPCYNEEENIERVVSRLSERASGVDYLIINDELDACVEEVHRIIQGEHRRSFRNREFIEHMQKELKGE